MRLNQTSRICGRAITRRNSTLPPERGCPSRSTLSGGRAGHCVGLSHDSRLRCGWDSRAPAFTLIEVLLAVSVFAIVLIAINTVFYSALRLRQSTVLALDASTPIQQVSSMMKRDLQCALPPGGIITGDFKCGAIGGTMGVAQAEGIEFFTTTGILTSDAPWGDVRKVSYQLRDAATRSPMGGRELIRSVTRNLLSTLPPETDDQFLMSDVDSLEFLCYDGSNWRNTWDTSLSDTNLPLAVKVRIQLSSDRNVDVRSRAPIEMVVSLFSQSLTNQLSTPDSTGTTSQ